MDADEAMARHSGVVRLADHRELRSAWARHARSGRVIRALPGVVLDAALRDDPAAWMRAVHAWDCNAVLAGRAAAWLTFAPAVAVTQVLVYSRTRLLDRGPLRFRRHELCPELTGWVEGMHVTTPEATALTAALEGDFEPATTALRSALVGIDSLREAARALRVRPAATLRAVLRDLSGNPWSVAEVEAHRLLRAAGVTGWIGNHHVSVGGMQLVLDIALVAARVAFEVNSFQFHSSRDAQARDAVRLNALLAAGWRVYTLTPAQIRLHPEETAHWIRSVVRRRERRGIGRGEIIGT